MKEYSQKLPNQFKFIKEGTESDRIPCRGNEIHATGELSHANEGLHSTVSSCLSWTNSMRPR